MLSSEEIKQREAIARLEKLEIIADLARQMLSTTDIDQVTNFGVDVGVFIDAEDLKDLQEAIAALDGIPT